MLVWMLMMLWMMVMRMMATFDRRISNITINIIKVLTNMTRDEPHHHHPQHRQHPHQQYEVHTHAHAEHHPHPPEHYVHSAAAKTAAKYKFRTEVNIIKYIYIQPHRNRRLASSLSAETNTFGFFSTVSGESRKNRANKPLFSTAATYRTLTEH